MSDAAGRIVARSSAGRDALVAGSSGEAAATLAAALPALAGLGTVIAVQAPAGELGLSSLIAQVSGNADLGGQDDAVLELGFRRLTGPGRTILVMQAPRGVSRSALRYVQHVLRQAPTLSLVVSASPELAALLADPAFAALRARLDEAPPQPQPAIPSPETAALPEARPRRRFGLWFGAALAVAGSASAAVMLGGLRGPATDAIGLPRPTPAFRLASTASLPASTPAATSEPVLQRAAAPPLAVPPRPALAAALPPQALEPVETELAQVTPGPLATPPTPPIAAALPPLKPAVAERRFVTRRTEPAYGARYAQESGPEPAPIWADPEPWRQDGPYLGTYAVDPYAARRYRYGR